MAPYLRGFKGAAHTKESNKTQLKTSIILYFGCAVKNIYCPFGPLLKKYFSYYVLSLIVKFVIFDRL